MKLGALWMCCALMAAGSAHAQKACSSAEASAAQKAVDKIVTWQNLDKAWHDYRHCDTGNVAEGFTDGLMRLMVGWKNMDVAASAMAKDAEFKDWVHKRLLNPASKDDAEDVYALAKKNCPKGQNAFCDELASVLKSSKGEAFAPINLEPLKPITGK